MLLQMQCYLQQFVQPIIEKKVDLKPLFSEEEWDGIIDIGRVDQCSM